MKIFCSLSLAVMLCMLLALPVAADTLLYDNGPYNGTLKAWTIHSPFAVSNSFTLSQFSVALSANTYWFELENGVTRNKALVFWDIDNGPSEAYQQPLGINVNGYLFPGTNSDSFRIHGSNSVVAEPTSLFLLGAGLSAIGLATWRKRR
jgi:hypothetical protein